MLEQEVLPRDKPLLTIAQRDQEIRRLIKRGVTPGAVMQRFKLYMVDLKEILRADVRV